MRLRPSSNRVPHVVNGASALVPMHQRGMARNDTKAAEKFWSILRHGMSSRIRNEREWLEVFGTNSRLQAPINAIATDLSEVEWKLWEITTRADGKQEKREILNHPFLDLWRHPHPGLVHSVWIQLCQTYLELVGRCPLWMRERDRSGRPTQLTPFPPHWISEYPDSEDLNFKVNWGDGQYFVIPARDLVWMYRPDPLNPFGDGGLGLARCLDDDVAQDEAMAKFNNYYFRHSAFLGAIVNIPGCDPEEVAELWRQTREGVSNAHRTLFTNSTTGTPIIQNLTPALRELNFQDSRTQVADFMRQLFGLPPERLGILVNSNRSTIDAADFLEQRKIIKPRAKFWMDTINTFILPRYGNPNLRFEFVDPVLETSEELRKKVETAVRMGLYSVNEARKKMGDDPIPGGDVLYVPINNVMAVPVGVDIAEYLAEMASKTAPAPTSDESEVDEEDEEDETEEDPEDE